MKKIILIILITLVFLLPKNAMATYDPTSLPNNKFGIHILYPSELDSAKKLVDSSGGDWGYVTIPIQAGDKDIVKWQKFMDEAKQLHVIPIIRLATEGDYFDTTVWRKPDDEDVLDFANFLNSLNWPTKNRYIIVFNEVNRSDEWGGNVDPASYANLLSYTVSTFKSRNSNFFIISSGMDNASINTVTDMNEYTYFSEMNDAVPGIFNQIDGISSHSYPNPGFLMPSSFLSTKTIDTFYYEKKYIEGISSKIFPVFITETGWDSDKIDKSQIGKYYEDAFSTVWNDPSVIAVTPFIFQAGTEPFSKFSFLNQDGSQSDIYKDYANIPKIKGIPQTDNAPKVLAARTTRPLPVKNYSNEKFPILNKLKNVQSVLKRIFLLQ